MTSENLSFVLETVRAFEAEDFELLERAWHPQGRVTSPDHWPEPGPFEGRDAVVGQFRRLASDMGVHRVRDIRVIADRESWVVLCFVWEVQGAESGAALASRLCAAYHVSQGRLDQAHFRWTPEQALEAAELPGRSSEC